MDGSPLKGRGLSPVGVAVGIGQREFFANLRKEYRAGPCVNVGLIANVIKYADGDPLDDGARTLAERAMAEAKAKANVQSSSGGKERSACNHEVKKAVIRDHHDLFDKVRSGGLSVSRAAQLLRSRLVRSRRDGWKPSVRTLNDWFAEYRTR